MYDDHIILVLWKVNSHRLWAFDVKIQKKEPCHTGVPRNTVRVTYPTPFIRFNLKMCTTSQLGKEFKDVIPVSCSLTDLTVLISFQRLYGMCTLLTRELEWGEESLQMSSKQMGCERCFKARHQLPGYLATQLGKSFLWRGRDAKPLPGRKIPAQIAGRTHSYLIHGINYRVNISWNFAGFLSFS